MCPLGLSGSIFLGLLILYFYHFTNRDLYLVLCVLGLEGGGGGGVFLNKILTFFEFV